MTLLINTIILIVVGITHWKISKITKTIEAQLNTLAKKQSKFMTHLTRELKIPMPEFDEKPSVPRDTLKPRVTKRTENDEFERELPPNKSGLRTI